ncbi:hypothetical protein GCM10022225_09810 [Plantactinospora mayteni]
MYDQASVPAGRAEPPRGVGPAGTDSPTERRSVTCAPGRRGASAGGDRVLTNLRGRVRRVRDEWRLFRQEWREARRPQVRDYRRDGDRWLSVGGPDR